MEESSMTETQQTMLKGLARRSEESKSIKKIDNGSLYAGSPMYYYCKLCGLLAATLPETHWGPSPKYCEPCKAMIAAGFDSNAKQFG